MSPLKSYRRGYAVALLVGLGESQAVLWKVFSKIVKLEKIVSLAGSRKDVRALYNFHEAIVNEMRPMLSEGVKSVVVASAPRTNYAEEFLEHVRDHHAWLAHGAERAAFAKMTGAATTVHEMTMLTRTPEFRKKIGETTMHETENLLELLEKSLNAPGEEPLVLYSLEDIEDKILRRWVPGQPKPEYLILADTFLSGSRQKNRLQRLMQLAANRKVKSRIVRADSAAGKRLLQLGGMVCILKLE